MRPGDDDVSRQDEAPERDPAMSSSSSSELLQRLRAHAPATSRYRILDEVGRGGMGAVPSAGDVIGTGPARGRRRGVAIGEGMTS